MRYALTFTKFDRHGSFSSYYGEQVDQYDNKVIVIKEAMEMMEHGIYDVASISYFCEDDNCFKRLLTFDLTKDGKVV